MTNTEPHKIANVSTTEVTINGRDVSPAFALPIVFAGTAITVIVGVVAALLVLFGISVLFGSLAALVGLVVLSFPAIYVVDKLLKKGGRKGFITGQNADGLTQLNVDISTDGFKKPAPTDGWTAVDEPKIFIEDDPPTT